MRSPRLLLAAALVGAVAVSLPPGGSAALAARPTLAANRAAARADADALLARLVLPAGASASATEPAGDGGVLGGPGIQSGDPTSVDRHAWWQVPGSPAAVIRFVREHRPAGSAWSSEGSASATGKPTEQLVVYQWPPVAGVLGVRSLSIGAVALPGGVTGVRADAEVQWIVPRPTGERIPAAARVLQVTVATPGSAPVLSRTVSDRRTVAAIAALIDRQEIVQPGVIPCPEIPAGQPFVSFTFRARPAGPALAQGRVAAAGTGPGSACDPMTLTIGGRREPDLVGGPVVVRAAQRLLGVRLTRGA